MKNLLVLGAGTAGTMVVNKLSHHLDPNEWKITIVDEHETHYYQPGFLFIPFGIYGQNDVIKARRDFIPAGVELIVSRIELIEADNNRVLIEKNKRYLDYDMLVIATGAHPRPDQTPGLMEGGWRDSIHDFYSFEGTVAWRANCATGKVVAWWSTSWSCLTSARSRRWNSASWPIPTSTSAACVTRLN